MIQILDQRNHENNTLRDFQIHLLKSGLSESTGHMSKKNILLMQSFRIAPKISGTQGSPLQGWQAQSWASYAPYTWSKWAMGPHLWVDKFERRGIILPILFLTTCMMRKLVKSKIPSRYRGGLANSIIDNGS